MHVLLGLVLLMSMQTRAVIIGGQSLSVYSTDAATSTTQTHGNKMPTGNTINSVTPFPAEITASAWPWVDLVEATYETPRHALADYFQSATGNSLLMIHCGQGGTAYSGLAAGTAPFTVCARGIEAFGARQTGETVVAFAVVHGESDRTSATYDTDLAQWQADMEAKAHASTETQGRVPLYVSQIASCTAPLYALTTLDTCVSPIEVYRAAKDNPLDIVLVEPRYQTTHTSADGIHWDASEAIEHGAMLGKVIAYGPLWEPTWPTLVTRAGAVIDVTFHVPVPPLVLDDILVSNPGDYGFSYIDDSSPPAISSVALLDADTVRITLASTPTGANKKIRYAYTGTSGNFAGPTTGMRGNLRDSDTATWGGVNLYNWCVHFTEDVP